MNKGWCGQRVTVIHKPYVYLRLLFWKLHFVAASFVYQHAESHQGRSKGGAALCCRDGVVITAVCGDGGLIAQSSRSLATYPCPATTQHCQSLSVDLKGLSVMANSFHQLPGAPEMLISSSSLQHIYYTLTYWRQPVTNRTAEWKMLFQCFIIKCTN